MFFKPITGLDGAKKGAVLDTPEEKLTPVQNAEKPLIVEANLFGGRKALQITSWVPATMAAFYLLLLLYFKAKGGYKAVHIEGSGSGAKEVA